MMSIGLYMAQRVSAMLMAPFVLVHLGVIVYAVQGGLTTSEILARTQGSLFWMLFYGGFVVAASIHGAIGLRVVVHEWTGIRGVALSGVTWGSGVLMLGLGLRAVAAVALA